MMRKCIKTGSTFRSFSSQVRVLYSPDLNETVVKPTEEKHNRIVNFETEAIRSMERDEVIDQEKASGTEGMSEERFRREILEHHLDHDFGLDRDDVVASSREASADE